MTGINPSNTLYFGYIYGARLDLSIDKSYLVVIGDNSYNVKPVAGINSCPVSLTNTDKTTTGGKPIPEGGTFWISCMDGSQRMAVATTYDSNGMLLSIYEVEIDAETVWPDEESNTFGKIYGKWVPIYNLNNIIQTGFTDEKINGHFASTENSYYIEFVNDYKFFTEEKKFILVYNNELIEYYLIKNNNIYDYNYAGDLIDDRKISPTTNRMFHFYSSYAYECYIKFIDINDKFINAEDVYIPVTPEMFRFFEITNDPNDEVFELPLNNNFIDFNSYITNKNIINKPFGDYYDYNNEYETITLYSLQNCSFVQTGPIHTGIFIDNKNLLNNIELNDIIQIILDGEDLGMCTLSLIDNNAGSRVAAKGGYCKISPFSSEWTFYSSSYSSGSGPSQWAVCIAKNYRKDLDTINHDIIINKVTNITTTREEKTKKLDEKYLGLHFYKEPIELEVINHDTPYNFVSGKGNYYTSKLINEDLVNETVDIEIIAQLGDTTFKIISKNLNFSQYYFSSNFDPEPEYYITNNTQYNGNTFYAAADIYINDELSSIYTYINLGSGVASLYINSQLVKSTGVTIYSDTSNTYISYNTASSFTFKIIQHTYKYHQINSNFIDENKINFYNLKNVPFNFEDNTSEIIWQSTYPSWMRTYQFTYSDKLKENEYYTFNFGDFYETVQCKKSKWSNGTTESLTLNLTDISELPLSNKILKKWVVFELSADNGVYMLVLNNADILDNSGNKLNSTVIKLYKGKVNYSKLNANFINNIITIGDNRHSIKSDITPFYDYLIGTNTASGERNICLGFQNITAGTTASILGGYLNICNSYGGTITGGEANQIGKIGDNQLWFNTISGGSNNNIISGMYSAIVGGQRNITLNEAEIAGGNCNESNTGEEEKDKTIFSIGNGKFNNLQDIIRHNAIEVRRNGDLYIPDTQLIGQPIPETEDTYDHMTIPMINVLEYIRSLEQRIKDLEEKLKDTE